jgi:hypothetical protein
MFGVMRIGTGNQTLEPLHKSDRYRLLHKP